MFGEDAVDVAGAEEDEGADEDDDILLLLLLLRLLARETGAASSAGGGAGGFLDAAENMESTLFRCRNRSAYMSEGAEVIVSSPCSMYL